MVRYLWIMPILPLLFLSLGCDIDGLFLLLIRISLDCPRNIIRTEVFFMWDAQFGGGSLSLWLFVDNYAVVFRMSDILVFLLGVGVQGFWIMVGAFAWLLRFLAKNGTLEILNNFLMSFLKFSQITS